MSETLCDFCHEREAVFFIEQTQATGKQTLHICPECALARGVSADPATIGKSIKNLFSELANITKKAVAENNRACPVCGTKLLSIKNKLQAGCPECYAVFKKDIEELLKKQGVESAYTGSMPRRLAKFKSVLTDRIMIQTKLEDSLRREDYEKAAVYRDYLRALESQPVNGSDGSDEEENHA